MPPGKNSVAMKEDETKLFRELVGDVEPLKTSGQLIAATKVEITPGMKVRRLAAEASGENYRDYLDDEDLIVPVKPWDELSFKRDGVQHGVFKNLRLGKYALDSRLDLHRMTVEMARKAVLQFITDCVAANIRCVLITHGRGEQREKPALLKSCTNHWLRQMDAVLAFHSAQRHHGGFGATYVLLRKSDEKREENKEKFSKRGS
ncbi:MAG: DNA endonuclease SmrA [Porticoccaceae bacterium]